MRKRKCRKCNKEFVVCKNNKFLCQLCGDYWRKKHKISKGKGWVYQKKYEAKNKKINNKKRRDYARIIYEVRKESFKKWYSKNKDKFKEYSLNRRKKNPKYISMVCGLVTLTRKRIREIHGNKCKSCGALDNLQIHHKKYFKISNSKKPFTKEMINKIKKYTELLCLACHRMLHRQP